MPKDTKETEMTVELERTHSIADPDPLAGKVVKRCEFDLDSDYLKQIVFEDGTALRLDIRWDMIEAELVESVDA